MMLLSYYLSADYISCALVKKKKSSCCENKDQVMVYFAFSYNIHVFHFMNNHHTQGHQLNYTCKGK